LLAICSRSASVGTTTSRRSNRWLALSASIVSVLPVPVGMTMVAGSVDRVAWASAA
jgi:hypothetical protein